MGNMDTSALYIVPDGKIIFALDKEDSCDDITEVSGMFMAGVGFATQYIRNNDLRRHARCSDGRLVIKGQLLGPRGTVNGDSAV